MTADHDDVDAGQSSGTYISYSTRMRGPRKTSPPGAYAPSRYRPGDVWGGMTTWRSKVRSRVASTSSASTIGVPSPPTDDITIVMFRSGRSGSPPTHRPPQPLLQVTVSLHSLVQVSPRTMIESPALNFVGPSRRTLGASQAACAGERPKAATSTAPTINHRVCERATTGRYVRRCTAGLAA
jgi:hypothetical protein